MFVILVLQKVPADLLNITIVPYLHIINTSILYLHLDKELTYLMKISVNLIISFLLLLNKGKLFLTFIKRKILNALNLHSTTTLTKINYQQEILTYLEELDFQKENLKKLLQKIILFAKAELMKILKNIY